MYQMVELREGVQVQYVGVYVLRWRPEWGQPTVGFVEVDDTEVTDYDRLYEAAQEVLYGACIEEHIEGVCQVCDLVRPLRELVQDKAVTE